MAETKSKIDELFFNNFKQSLAIFISDNFNACNDFIAGIDNAETEKDLIKYFKKNRIQVYEHLGGDLDYDSGADDLENKIDNLESVISDLEDELEEAKKVGGLTLEDDYKLEHFANYKGNFTESELEELLKNGKE